MKIELTAQEAIELLSNRMSETQFSAESGRVSEELQKENEELKNRLEPLRVENTKLQEQVKRDAEMIAKYDTDYEMVTSEVSRLRKMNEEKTKPHPLLVKLGKFVRDSGTIPDHYALLESPEENIITYGEIRALAKELEGV